MRALRPARAILLAALLTGCAAAPAPPPLDAKADAAVDPKATVFSYASGLKVADISAAVERLRGTASCAHSTAPSNTGGQRATSTWSTCQWKTGRRRVKQP